MVGMGSHVGQNIICHRFNREYRLSWCPDVYHFMDNNARRGKIVKRISGWMVQNGSKNIALNRNFKAPALYAGCFGSWRY
jgi:hypothetical protein